MSIRICLMACLLASVCAVSAQDTWQPQEGWYTAHHDVMRSGRSQYGPGVPFKKVWHQEYWDEMISAETEPIVAEGNVFFGTWGGFFYALDALTGQEVWKNEAVGGVRNTATYDAEQDLIIYATIGNRNGGAVVACEAATGREVWSFEPGTRGGFCVNPALYKGLVIIGGRDGVLYALDAADGSVRWRWVHPQRVMFMQACAIRDGKVAVAAEDCIPRCFDAETGRLLWAGAAMQTDSVRFYYPVFWKDSVIFRGTAPSGEIDHGQHIVEECAGEDGDQLQAIFKDHAWKEPHWEFMRNKHKLFTDKKFTAEQECIREAIEADKAQKTFYMLNVADGQETIPTSILYAGSENGYSTPTPPSIGPDGSLYLLFRTFWSQYEYPIRAYDCIGTLDYETGLPYPLPRADDRYRSDFPITADEVNMFTWGGDKLYCTHDHNFAYWDSEQQKVIPAYAPKNRAETWGGIYLTQQQIDGSGLPDSMFALEGPTESLLVNNEWNGTSRGSVAIYKDHVWWITGNMIVCLQGTISE